MTFQFQYAPGATPLDRDEIFISTQGELNAAEQANILEAQSWALGQKHKDILSAPFIRKLHQRIHPKGKCYARSSRGSHCRVSEVPLKFEANGCQSSLSDLR